MSDAPEVYLARHGETAWTITRQHTGRTDLPLTERGEANARGPASSGSAGLTFDRVFASPLAAGPADVRAGRVRRPGRGRRRPDSSGTTAPTRAVATAEIRHERPGWSLFRDGCPGGESVAAVGARADRVIARLRRVRGRTSCSSATATSSASWPRAGWACRRGTRAASCSSTAALCVLGYEHALDDPAILLWNDDRHAVPADAVGTGAINPRVAIDNIERLRRTPSYASRVAQSPSRNQEADGRHNKRPSYARTAHSSSTNAGRSRSPGRPTPRTSGTWSSTTSSGWSKPTRASGSRPWPGRSATCSPSAG